MRSCGVHLCVRIPKEKGRSCWSKWHECKLIEVIPRIPGRSPKGKRIASSASFSNNPNMSADQRGKRRRFSSSKHEDGTSASLEDHISAKLPSSQTHLHSTLFSRPI